MISRTAWALGLAVALATAQQSGSPPAEPEEPIVRISINLVQVDAVVTDSGGHQITNLTADDFEVLEDRRPQKITAFSYVKTAGPQPVSARPAAPVKNSITPPMPPAPHLTPQQVRRTVVLMVDDLGLSFESTYYVRRALKKFVDDDMREGDLVAIIRTSAGMGSLQQFTADKRILYEAIERVRWNLLGGGGIGIFPALGSDPAERANALLAGGRSGSQHSQAGAMQPSNSASRGLPNFNQGRTENSMIGALGAVTFIVHALRDLPGRKAIILFSDGIPFGGGETPRLMEQMHTLTDLANRAAVVIYTVDARGLQALSITAADNPVLRDGTAGQTLADGGSSRRAIFFESQQGLEYLAQQTGGFSIHDSNDLAGGVRRVLDDLSGYYLIGYRPGESSFAPAAGYRQFHKIQVKMRVPRLQVRSRTGYLGIPDEESRPVYRTPRERLLATLVSPFTSGELKLRLTCLFSEVPKVGAVVRSLLYIDPHNLTYAEEPGGSHTTRLDIVALAFGERGTIVGSVDHTVTVRLTPEEYSRAVRIGFLYTMDIKLEKPGGYQVRAAVRDTASEKVGSASQFLEVPDVGKHRLALSGIVLNGVRSKISASSTTGPEENYSLASSGSPAVRVFRPGQTITYSYVIFNAELEAKSGHTELETQVLLYRDSKPVYTGAVTPFKSDQKADLTRLLASGALRLGANLESGEYLLQIAAWDKLAPQKRQLATQWTDLEMER
jgi:VWFA-related protein